MPAQYIKYFVLSAYLLSPFFLSAKAQVEEVKQEQAKQKAEFLFDFTKSKYIQWPEEIEGDDFQIGVLQDSLVYRQLRSIVSKKMFLFRKPVQVKFHSSIQGVHKSHILYFDQSANYPVKRIIKKLQDAPTLLVGSNFPFNSIMVNFIPTENDISIDVNATMIEQQGLKPTDELLQLRAKSEEQWDQLLEKAKTRIKEERNKLAAKKEELRKKEHALKEAVQQLEKRRDSLEQRTQTLKNLGDSLLNAKQHIAKQDLILMKKEEQISLHRQIRYGMIIILVLALGLIFFIYWNYRVNKKGKEKLAKYNKALHKKHERIVAQKKIIERKNRDIMDSIKYAKRIQSAIMPPHKYVKQYIPESFILFKPKEMVSGDFYWVNALDNDRFLFAVVDCTGHGVPGAFISIVGYNSLIRTVNEFQLEHPSKILDKLNELVREALQQKYSDIQDGMDIALCMLNFKEQRLEFAGANNPIYLVRDGEVIEQKGDKQAIGSFDFKENFTNHCFELNEGDTFYIFSDGYPDQFGGPRGKKFMYHRFRKTLVNLQDRSMLQQQDELNTIFEDWKGDESQIDDVCVIGMRV